MKQLLLIVLIVSGCRPIDPPPTPTSSFANAEKVFFPCDQFNFSNEWLYCTPVSIDLTSVTFAQIEMNYSFRNQRGGESIAQAELFDLDANTPIPYSFTESTQVYTMHTRTTDDLSNYFTNQKYNLVIRFRSSLPDHTCYISDNSYIAIY